MGGGASGVGGVVEKNGRSMIGTKNRGVENRDM